jgi:hypothetical protein
MKPTTAQEPEFPVFNASGIPMVIILTKVKNVVKYFYFI